MNRILLFCQRDWRHPRAGQVEEYVFNVFSRIAAWDNHVTWACQGSLFPNWGRERPLRMETVDGIQVAPLAPPLLYRRAAGMLGARLAEKSRDALQLDVLIDCVSGAPLPLADHATFPIVPLVFDLNKKQRGSDAPPGPIIAPSARSRRRLIESGIPNNFIVSAFAGCDPEFFTPSTSKPVSPTLVAVGRGAHRLRRMLKSTQPEMSVLTFPPGRTSVRRVSEATGRTPVHRVSEATGRTPVHRVSEATGRTPVRRVSEATCVGTEGGNSETKRELYQQAWFGYCGRGAEREALVMAACGVPVICPMSDVTAEYVEDGQTGFLVASRGRRELMMRIQQLATDTALRERLGEQAREYAEARSWDRTASLVLATLENLKPQRRPVGSVR